MDEESKIPAGALECPVCRHSYSSKEAAHFPRLLKCGHSFCSSCLESILVSSQLICGVCEEVTLVGDNGVKSLGTNLPLLESIQLSKAPLDDWADEEDDDGWSALYYPERNSNDCEICLTPFDDDVHSRERHPSSAYSICRLCLSKLTEHNIDDAEWIMPADPPLPKSGILGLDSNSNILILSDKDVARQTATKCAKEAVTATAATQFAKTTIEKTVTKAVPIIDVPVFRDYFGQSVTSSVVSNASRKVVFASSGAAAALCDLGISTVQDAYRWSKGKPVSGIAKNVKNAAWTGVCSGTGFVIAGPVGAFVGGMLAPKYD